MATRRSGRRPDYDWLNVGDVLLAQDIASEAAFTGTGIGIGASATLTRIRGKIGCTLDAGGVDEAGLVLAAIGLFDTDSFAAGSAPEIFNPSTDEHSWIWQGQLYLSSGSEGAVVSDQLSASIEVDAKAMRRWKPGSTLALVTELPTELWSNQTGTVDTYYFLHALIAA